MFGRNCDLCKHLEDIYLGADKAKQWAKVRASPVCMSVVALPMGRGRGSGQSHVTQIQETSVQ